MYRVELYWTDGNQQLVEQASFEQARSIMAETWARRGFVGQHGPGEPAEIYSAMVRDLDTEVVMIRFDSFEAGMAAGNAATEMIWRARYEELRDQLNTGLGRVKS